MTRKPGAEPDPNDAAVEAMFEMRNRDREEFLKTGRLPGDPPKASSAEPAADPSKVAATDQAPAADAPAKPAPAAKPAKAAPKKPAKKPAAKAPAKAATKSTGEPKDAFF
jgi:hypothetical protein